MLDKTEYYHGAAIVRLLEDERCQAVKKHGSSWGYVVNGEMFVYLKYTTKARTPWGFTFDQDDVDRCIKMAGDYTKLIVGLVCGGDGVCALDWSEATVLLNGRAGRIAAGRKHNESYAVWGTAGELKRKIPVGRWPILLFESNEQTINYSNANKLHEQPA